MMRTTCFFTGQVDWGWLISRQSYIQVSKGTKLFFSEALGATATSLGRESQKGFQSRWLGKSSGLMQPQGVVYFWGSTLVSGGECLKYGWVWHCKPSYYGNRLTAYRLMQWFHYYLASSFWKASVSPSTVYALLSAISRQWEDKQFSSNIQATPGVLLLLLSAPENLCLIFSFFCLLF